MQYRQEVREYAIMKEKVKSSRFFMFLWSYNPRTSLSEKINNW